MEDPVILPTSNINLDRKTIEHHLELVSIDPFNKKPLTKKDLIPNIELKKRIDEYKLKKIKDFEKEKSKKEVNKKSNMDKKNEEK